MDTAAAELPESFKMGRWVDGGAVLVVLVFAAVAIELARIGLSKFCNAIGLMRFKLVPKSPRLLLSPWPMRAAILCI